jgi:hypothetical protein
LGFLLSSNTTTEERSDRRGTEESLANPCVAKDETDPDHGADVDRKETMAEERVADADVDRDGSAEVVRSTAPSGAVLGVT